MRIDDSSLDGDNGDDARWDEIDYPSEPEGDENDEDEAESSATSDSDDAADAGGCSHSGVFVDWHQQVALINFTSSALPTASLLKAVDSSRRWPFTINGARRQLKLLSFLCASGLRNHISIYHSVYPLTVDVITCDGDDSALCIAKSMGRRDIADLLLTNIAADRERIVTMPRLLSAIAGAGNATFALYLPSLQSFRYLLKLGHRHSYPCVSKHIQQFVQGLRNRHGGGKQLSTDFTLTDEDVSKVLCVLHYSLRRADALTDGTYLFSGGSSSSSGASVSSTDLPFYRKTIQFLIALEAVRGHVTTAFMGMQANWLIELAIQYPSRIVFDQLAALPGVVAEASKHHYYLKDEFTGSLGLRDVVAHSESSMHALCHHERSALAKARAHYSALNIARGGDDAILEQIRQDAIRRYIEDPVRVTLEYEGNSEDVTIPHNWNGKLDSFSKCMTKQYPETIKYHAFCSARAKIYRHKIHAAYRYLLHNNPFRQKSSRLSSFMTFKSNIVLCYLAAGDRGMPSVDGSDITDRISLFFEQLALQQRAHNRDHGVDDGLADKTTCSGGTNKRLLQSVLNHPLFIIVTHDIVKQALNEHIRAHYKRAVTLKNCRRMHQLVEMIIGDDGEDDPEEAMAELNEFDIDHSQCEVIIDKVCYQLVARYGADFSRKQLSYRLMMMHLLDRTPHVFNFYMDANLKQLIDKKLSKLSRPVLSSMSVVTGNKRSHRSGKNVQPKPVGGEETAQVKRSR